MSTFCTARLTNLGSKTVCISYTFKLENVECRQLAFPTQCCADITSSKGIFEFYAGSFVSVHYIIQKFILVYIDVKIWRK